MEIFNNFVTAKKNSMMNLEELKEAAKNKLDGYTEKEIECFVQGAMFMAGHLPQKHDEEWYRKRAEEKQAAAERSDAICKFFQDTTGLKSAVDAIRSTRTEGEVINHAFEVLFSNMMDNPQFRAVMLDMLGAEDKSVSREIIEHLQMSCRAFNRNHVTQLEFSQLEENNDRWTLTWDEPV